MTGVEVNQRAVLLANENAAALGLQDRFVACDPGRRRPPTRRTTRSGPTHRSGSASRRCTSCCCTGSPGWRSDGRAVMVVGKNLGGDSLQAWLTDQGYPTTRLASAKGFRVLESRREMSTK